MIVVVNQKEVDVDAHTTVAALLASLGYPDRGVAVALDAAVLPRSSWAAKLAELSGFPSSTQPLQLEVLTAVQGG